MNEIRRRMRKSSAFRNIFLAMLALILAITVLLTSVLLISYFSAASQMTSRYFGNLLKQCNYSITYLNDLAQRLSASLMIDRNVIAFLNMERNESEQTAVTHQAILKTIIPLSYVDSVYLYNRSLDLLLCTKTGTQNGLETFYDAPVVERIHALEEDALTPNEPFAHEVGYQRAAPVSVYSYVVPEFDKAGELTSAMFINISVDVLTQSLQQMNANNENVKYAVADADGRLLVSPSFETAEEYENFQSLLLENVASAKAEREKTVRIGSERYHLAYTTENSNGWYLYALIPHNVIFAPVVKLAVISVLIDFLLLVLFCVVTFRLAQHINKPVEVIKQLAEGEISDAQELAELKSEEFRTIAASFTKMRRENDEFSRYKDTAAKLFRKEFLENLFCGKKVFAADVCAKNLKELDCLWMQERPIVMCLFAIDDYETFAQQNNPQEREALRFAVVNVATELLEQNFLCEMIEHGPSRFVAVVSRKDDAQQTEESTLDATLTKIIAIVKKHLDFSLTVAHGTQSRGVSFMPRAYENLEELLMLRLCHGYGRVLTPEMAEELELADFRVSAAAENLLTASVASCNPEQALSQFDAIARDLFRFSPTEVLPYLIQLAYRLLSTVKDADSSAGPQATQQFKAVATRLPQCEIEKDFRRCFTDYLTALCDILSAQRAAQDGQNSNILVHRILKIIESDYSQKELCLNSIADDLGLSTHYVGQIFRADQGKSVSQYLLDLRLEKIARALRETNRPFSQIMEDMGFEAKQKNYIYTLFKKHFGVTVKAYRLQYSENVGV